MSSSSSRDAHDAPHALVLEPARIQPSILFDGAEWLVVDKPPGWHSVRHTLTHGGPTVEEWLRETRPEQDQLPEAGLVHRLDASTRGCLVAARDRVSYAWLRDAFSKDDGRVQKTYRALTAPGIPDQGQFCLYFFSRHKGSARMSVREAGEARELGRCGWQVLRRSSAEALVEVRLLGPGRRHQIRAGLAQLGYPLLGDALYGGQPDARFPLGAALLAVEVQILNQKVSLRLADGEAFAG